MIFVMKMQMKMNRKIKKILKDVESLKKESNVRFVFSYIDIGKTLNDMDADVIHNIGEDLASQTLMLVIEDKVFGISELEPSMEEIIKEKELAAKLHMFNLFNKNKKFEA